MMYYYKVPLCGEACLQGNRVVFNGYAAPKKGEVISVGNFDFTVGSVNKASNTFMLALGNSDEVYGVELPAYMREELIATLKGWDNMYN